MRAADEGCSQTGQRPLGRLALARHEPRLHRRRLPLQIERRRELLEGEVRACRTCRPLTDEDRPPLGCLLQARGDVDRVAGDEHLPARLARRDHLAGIEADADLELPARVTAEVPAREPLEHPSGGPHGAHCIVLSCGGHAEDGHDRVAGELLDRCGLRAQLLRHRREEIGHQGPDVLGVHCLGALGRADDVGEQDGDELQHLGCGRSRRRGRRGREHRRDVEVRVLLEHAPLQLLQAARRVDAEVVA